MMEKFKILLLQAMMITFGILVGVSIEGVIWHFLGREFSMEWYQLPSLLLAGVVCSVPSLILGVAKEWPGKKYIAMIVLHCVVLFFAVMLLGYIFKWYDTKIGALAIVIEYFVVYAFVWGVTGWMGLLDEKHINKALADIRDDE